MTTAVEKFKVGQQVRMTQEALSKFLDDCNPKRRRGRVTGFPKYDFLGEATSKVSVVRNGERKPRTYHMDFWEPVE